MKHLTPNNLERYHNHELSYSETVCFENHLADCPNCMEAFLADISEAGILEAEKIIPSGFAEKIIILLGKKSEQAYPPKISTHIRPENFLAYYAAAAVLTIFLMGQGTFYDIINSFETISRMPAQKYIMPKSDLISLPGQITETTAQALENFENRSALKGGIYKNESKK